MIFCGHLIKQLLDCLPARPVATSSELSGRMAELSTHQTCHKTTPRQRGRGPAQCSASCSRQERDYRRN